jgi:hypothetical protein
LTAIKTASKRLPAVLWDDVQLDCPAWQHIPPKKREMIEEISISRPLLANLVMTAPSMSDLAKPLRRQVNWEVILPTRGKYEVHFIGKRRDFYQPVEDQSRLWYDVTGTFEVLPEEIMKLYNKRREEVARQLVRKDFIERQTFTEKVISYFERGYPPKVIAANLHCKGVEEVLKVLRENGFQV